MNQESAHLSDDEIQECANSSPGGCPQLTEVHLSECEFCLGRLLRWQRTLLRRLEIDGMQERPYPGCPDEQVLREVAAEIAPPDIANRTLQHAAQCDHCGPLLNGYLQAFSDELSPETEALIQTLPSSSLEYQRKEAREIASRLQTRSIPTPPVPRPYNWWRSLAWSAVAASVALFSFVAGPILYARLQIDKAGKLVTIASSMRSTTEMRVPGQMVKPDEIIVKGPNDGNDWTSKPEQLSEAEAIVKRYCSTRPDAKCLEISGRISRLEAQANSATAAADDFAKAIALSPEDPRLKIELAISYYDQRKSKNQPNLETTIKLLLEALHNPNLQPEDKKVATFDLAIAYERSELWPAAVKTWKDYLGLDESGPWRIEAQNRLERAQKKLPPDKPLSYKEPRYFLQHFADRRTLHDIEQYLQIAVREWLPDAVENPTSDAALAVHKLGDLLVEQHSDPWLRQFVNASRSNAAAGVKALSAAFTDNMNDLHQRAMKESMDAAEVFSRHKNLPGVMRARFEEVYALQRTLRDPECLSRAKKLGQLLAGSNYGWLLIQVELEKASCGDKAGLNESRKLNKKFRYPELGLRIVGFDAGIDKNQGHYDAAWNKAVDGLHTYWEGSYSWERLYQFYSVMWQCAKRNHSPRVAQALIQEGIEIFEKSAPGDTSLQAVLYLRLANDLRANKENELAEVETRKAISLLKSARDATAKEYALFTQIEFAEVELSRNRPELALSAIEPVRELIPTGHVPVKQDFYRTLGNTYWKLGRLDDAVSAYESAIDVTEKSIPPEGEARLHWLVAATPIYEGLTQVLLKQGKGGEALEVWERFKLLTFADRSQDSPPVGAALSSAAFFRMQAARLIYASFQDHLQVWMLKKGVVRTTSIAINRTDLQRLARDLADGCRSPFTDQETVDESERKLYSYLIQPMLAELPPGETVVIELDKPGDELSQVKVELLKSPQNRYFSDDHRIVYSPGILVENGLRAPLLLRKQEQVLFLNGTGNLPGNDLERDAVTLAFPQTLFIEGEGATIKKITNALEDRVALHYSGHALEDRTGMVLAVNSSTRMKAEDFQPKPLGQMRLVVLSACASDAAQNGLMDTNNLVRAFLLAGVPNIVASGWNVDSKTTARFMKEFYEGLGRGEAAAEALNDARKAVRSFKPHPYYWAAFSLTGRAD